MSSETAAPPPPLPELRTPARTLGSLADLVLFLLAAVVLFVVVNSVGALLLAWFSRPDHPGLSWSELLKVVAERHQFDAFFVVPVQLVFNLLLLCGLYGLVSGLRGLPFWRSMGFHRLAAGQVVIALAAGVLLALAVNFLGLLFPPPETVAFERLFSSRTSALLIVMTSLLAAPLFEETVFRGYIYGVVENQWGRVAAVLSSGLLFGSIHFPQLWPGYFHMLLICLVGVVFSLARAQAGTTVASVLLHLSYNAIISFFFLVSPTFRTLPASP